MTDEELAAIKARALEARWCQAELFDTKIYAIPTKAIRVFYRVAIDAHDLIAEIERLRQEQQSARLDRP